MRIRKALHRIKTRFLEVFFFLLYNPLARFYDWVASLVSLGMWNHWILRVIEFLPGPQVLELGHGPGHLITSLETKGITIFGIDTSSQMGKISKKRLLKSGQDYRMITGAAQHLPFPDLSFSQIVSTFPSEYILQPQTIREAYRVLQPGGTLVILPVAWITGENLIMKAAAWLFRVTDQAAPWNDQHLDHFRNVGFQIQQKMVSHDTWSLLIIFAKKIC